MALPPQNPPLAALESWARDRYGLIWPLRACVLKLIRCYQDTPAEPRPFAGRADLLERLDHWLVNGEDRLRLVSGPAGRGKSALLLHWMQRLIDQQRPVTLFYLPISIRFNTADEAAGVQLLFAALHDVFGELKTQLPQQPEREDYLEGIHRAWQQMALRCGEAFLLVVDGLDEAIHQWFIERRLLPTPLPPNLHVLLSARHPPGQASGTAWLQDLGIDGASADQVLEIGCLDREAMAQALLQLRPPLDALAERQAFTGHLHRLTDGGDPLLLTLWLSQIWRSRDALPDLAPEALAALQPGFGELYGLWRKEQQRLWEASGLQTSAEDVRQLMHVLAIALGPLPLPDLLAVLECLNPGRWAPEELRAVLESARRLVVGDDSGYVLVHPRLAQHFQEELDADPARRRAVHNAFREWGARTVRRLNSLELTPQDCPAYLLTHYVAVHLEAGQEGCTAVDEYDLPLLQAGWARAWHAREGAWHGYLNDLQRLAGRQQALNRGRLQAGHPPRLAAEMRCALLASTVRSLINNLPPELLVPLVREGIWSLARAARVARLLEPTGRARALTGLAEVANIQGLADDSESLRQEALEAAAAIEAPADRAHALRAAADAAHLHGEARHVILRQGLEAVAAIESQWERCDTLCALVPQLSDDSALLQQAVDVAQAATVPHARVRGLCAVASQLQGEARRTVLSQALDAVATAIQDDSGRADHLSELAHLLHADAALLQQAFRVAEGIEDPAARVSALTALAAQLGEDAQQRVLQQALQTAAVIPDARQRREALAGVAIASHGDVQRAAVALAVPALAQCPDECGAWLARIADCLAAAASRAHGPARRTLLEQALATAGKIEWPGPHGDALCGVAGHLEGDERCRVLELALELALRVEEENQRVEAISSVTSRVPQDHPLLQEVLKAAANLDSGDSRGKVLQAAASRMQGQARQALLAEAAAAFTTTYWRIAALCDLADVQHEDGRHTSLQQALQETGEIPLEAGIVVERFLAPRLRGEQALLQEALTMASSRHLQYNRRAILLALAPALQADSALWQQALTVAAMIQDERERALALCEVATHLQGDARRAITRQLLEQVAALQGNQLRFDVLRELTPLLRGDPDLLERSIELDAATGDLTAVAPHLRSDPALLRQALEAVAGIPDEGVRAYQLGELAHELQGDSALMRQALELIAAVQDEQARSRALGQVARHLNADSTLLRLALEAAVAVRDEELRGRALYPVASQMTADEALLNRVLEAAAVFNSRWWRSHLLAAVAALLQGEARTGLLRQALEVAAVIEDEATRMDALRTVAFQLHGESALVPQALGAAGAIRDEKLRACILREVARQLDAGSDLLPSALQAAAAIQDRSHRATVLCEVAARLQGEARRATTQQLLEMLAAIPESDRSIILNEMASLGLLQADRALLKQALVLTASVEHEYCRSNNLQHLADQIHADSDLMRQALELAAAIPNEDPRSRALAALAAQLRPDSAVMPQALEAAAAIRDPGHRSFTLSKLARQLTGEEQAAVLQQAFEAAAACRDIGRGRHLGELTEVLQTCPQLHALCLKGALALPETGTERIEISMTLTRQDPSFLTYDLWVTWLAHARVTRPELLGVIGRLTGCAVALTGRTEEAQEIAAAIQEVCKWFP